jgi:Tol biopolymer transport system component
MTSERWQRVKAIFLAAIEWPASERAAYIDAETGGDNALRAEVESLLASDANDSELLEPVQRAMLDSSLWGTLGVGGRFGSYEVVALIGAGAMGEVYQARDGRLGRDVALKVLPSPFALDPDRLARFRREAHVLASLNHPNIATIHGVEEAHGVQALVLELVEGTTLADRLAGGSIRLNEATPIAIQIARAVEAAHEKGIVHRDLKPANITVTPAGLVKVLDFGLAKPASPQAAPSLTDSHTGLLLGTASYMSPEQARGMPVDTRGDIWAFGCVLYEMLTGRLAFPGDTVADTIAGILEREPDWSAIPSSAPASIQRLVQRCVVKDPRDRLRDIGDARIELQAVETSSSATPSASIVGADRRRSPSLLLSVAAAVGVLAMAAVIGAAAFRRSAAAESALAGARFVPLTNWDGAEEGAEISPDGRFVAFLSDHDGEFDIWLTQVGTGHFTNLTRGVQALAPLGAIVRKLGFSGDGSEIWFNPAARSALMLMPSTGGVPRAFLGPFANTPAWSPDGTRLVYFPKPGNGDDPLYVADRNGMNGRELAAPQQGLRRNNPAWSPDGRWIYFVSGAEPQDETDIDIWRVPSSGGVPEPITRQHAAVNFVAPLDSRTLLYTARAEDGTGPWLWEFDLTSSAARRVPSGVDQYVSVAASRDGRRIVATVASPSGGVWRVPIVSAVAGESDARPFDLPAPAGRTWGPRFSRTATLFYLSDRGTADGLWKVEDGRAARIWRNVDGAISGPVAVAPDGHRLALIVRQGGRRHVSIMTDDGTNAHVVAEGVEIEGAAGQSLVDWSPDGRWLVAGGRDDKGAALFKIPVDGGVPERLIEGPWVNPVWSPQGDLIICAGRSLVGQVGVRGVRPDGTAVDVANVRVRPGGYRFLPDGHHLVFVPDIHARDFWLVDLLTGERRQLAHLGNAGTIQTFDVAPDGATIVFDRMQQNSNIVLIER